MVFQTSVTLPLKDYDLRRRVNSLIVCVTNEQMIVWQWYYCVTATPHLRQTIQCHISSKKWHIGDRVIRIGSLFNFILYFTYFSKLKDGHTSALDVVVGTENRGHVKSITLRTWIKQSPWCTSSYQFAAVQHSTLITRFIWGVYQDLLYARQDEHIKLHD